MTDLQKEIEALDRVLFRLASVDDERLVTVLDGLLPQLLELFPVTTTAPLEFQLKDKILQVITHIKTRLHGISTPRLPLIKLCAVVNSDDTMTRPRSSFTTTFAFMFIELGFAGATTEEKTNVLERLVKTLRTVGSSMQETFFRLLLSTFPATTSSSTPILSAEAPTVDIVLDFLLDVVVYQPPSTTSRSDSVVYGLMAPRIERLKRVKVTELQREALYDCQLHALQFVKNLGPAHPFRILHFVAGASSFHHVIKSFCEDQLNRVRSEDSEALENPTLCRDLMALIMSSQAVSQGRPLEGRDALVLGNRTRLADTSILAATALLKVSKAAANVLPLVLQVICQLMFAEEPSRPQNVVQKIRLIGAQLCEWSLHHTDEQYLTQFLGPVLLPTLMRTLMDPNADLDVPNAVFWREFRQHIYESVSVICTRSSTLVTNSEQPFQVLLVRCLVEEKNRAGMNALKAINALREAFEKSGDNVAVLVKIKDELKGLLQGTKLYDASSNYHRVRTIVGEWIETIIIRCNGTAAQVGHVETTDLRFALFALCGDDDEGVHRVASKALYVKPLPSSDTVLRTLQSMDRQNSSNLQSFMAARVAQQCLLFLQAVVMDEQNRTDKHDDPESIKLIMRYFVETLLQHPLEATSQQDSASLCATIADQVIDMHKFFASTIDTLLCGRTNHVVATIARATRSGRSALLSLTTILRWSLHAVETDIAQIMNTSLTTLEGESSTPASFSAALYTVGTIAGVLAHGEHSVPQSSEVVLRAARSLSILLDEAIQSVSKFESLPRGEEALNVLFGRVRSCIDAIGLMGNWNKLTLNPESRESVLNLRVDTVEQLRKVIDWKLDSVTADDGVKSRLRSVRTVTLEGISKATYESVWPGLCCTEFEKLVSSILKLGGEQECELQFSVADALVSMGTSITDGTMPYSARLVQRIIQDGAEARQNPVRRSAAIWLLCICAASLNSSAHPTWTQTFHSAAFADTLISIHEFFVTMLNDTDPVTTECAVKGLAYLRLKAPSAEIGDQFSDSLFRRLRCFRAFAPRSTSSSERDRGAEDEDSEERPATTQHAPASGREVDTIENVAYREVSNVAADIGDPELMYSLLYLSTTNPIWQALSLNGTLPSFTDGFSFSVVDKTFRASIITQANQQWMSEAYEHRKRLIPWLFLLKNHSNSKVSEVMGNLWNIAKGELTLTTSQEKSLLSQMWDTILSFLLAKLEYSRNFKYREACCVALIDLLNGADATQIEANFIQLWKLTSRSVDDVMEAVAVAGLKLFKALGELSLRIAAKHEGCRRELLDYLISHGMTTKNVVYRALSIDLLLRLVKEIDASALQDRLGALIVKLLEYLSSLEMPELQYAQFHVGDKKEQLEQLRVSMSQSGPVGQLLDQCKIKLKSLAASNNDTCIQIVEEIARGIMNLLKFGVGLNTRVGTANFAATVATELPFELRRCGGSESILSRALIPYVADRSASENDQYGDEDARYSSSSGIVDGLVLRSYLRAAAYLCPLVEPSSVKNYVRSGVFAVNRPSKPEATTSTQLGVDNKDRFADADTYTSRFLMVSALAIKDLIAKCPPISDASTLVTPDSRNEWYTSDVFPAAFIGQYASSEALRSVWTAVLEDLPPRITYSESALEATLSVLARWIRHPSWDTRRQGVKALQALFLKGTSYQQRLSSHQTDQIWNELMSAVPGRLWRGKGAILEALVAITSVRVADSATLVVLLVQECDRAWKNHELEYLESALGSLSSLATVMPSSEPVELLRFQLVVDLRNRLEMWRANEQGETDGGSSKILPPMLVKVVFETVASVFPTTVSTEAGGVGARETLEWLDRCFTDAAFHVWSVRRSIFGAVASVVRAAPASTLSNQHTINRLMDRCCGDFGVGDGKYSMVRVAAGDVLVALASRHNEPSIALQLTTQRERFSAVITVLRGSDETKEQQIAAQIFTQLTHSVAA